MSRCRLNAEKDGVFLESACGHDEFEIYQDSDGDVAISGPDRVIFLRASNAASLGDWLRRHFAKQDWRIGVDPRHTSIPLDVPTEKS